MFINMKLSRFILCCGLLFSWNLFASEEKSEHWPKYAGTFAEDGFGMMDNAKQYYAKHKKRWSRIQAATYWMNVQNHFLVAELGGASSDRCRDMQKECFAIIEKL